MSFPWHFPVLRLIATDRCRVAAPWFSWTRGRDAGSTLRRRANALERQALGATHPLEQALAALLYLPLSVPRTLAALWKNGRTLHAVDRVSFARQVLHLQVCAWLFGLRPQVYYQLRLHARPRLDAWRQVVDPAELHRLQCEISPQAVASLQDKLCFTARARVHGLPVIPLLETWRHGHVELPRAPVDALRRDLFVKRALSYSSIGVMAFRYEPLTDRHHDGTRPYTPRELSAALATASRDHALLVQPRLRNHPDLAGLSAEALCNYRIVTGRYPDGRTAVLMAALRFPAQSELTCAESETTLCAGVDLATGRLHAAESRNPALGRMPQHPATGQPIEGLPVPRWTEIKSLACAAHAAWPDFPFIGWDISDTADGIFLLEGGYQWGGFLAQMSGSPPLGQTLFAAIYSAHLADRENRP